jgi:hypothetical protein
MDHHQDGTMNARPQPGPRSGWLRALWAGLLSLVLPGLGQVYAGGWGNRGNSLDSRFDAVGYVPIGNVIGIMRTIYRSSDPGRLLSSVQ